MGFLKKLAGAVQAAAVAPIKAITVAPVKAIIQSKPAVAVIAKATPVAQAAVAIPTAVVTSPLILAAKYAPDQLAVLNKSTGGLVDKSFSAADIGNNLLAGNSIQQNAKDASSLVAIAGATYVTGGAYGAGAGTAAALGTTKLLSGDTQGALNAGSGILVSSGIPFLGPIVNSTGLPTDFLSQLFTPPGSVAPVAVIPYRPQGDATGGKNIFDPIGLQTDTGLSSSLETVKPNYGMIILLGGAALIFFLKKHKG